MKLTPLSLMLGAIALALVLVLGIETDFGRSIRLPLPKASALNAGQNNITPIDLFAADDLSLLEDTLKKPLFVPTRLPAPIATVVEIKPAAPIAKGLYQLTGTAIVGTTRLAFLRSVKDNKPMTVRVGSSLQNKRVIEITDNRVRLSENNEDEDLLLVLPPATARKSTQSGAQAAQITPSGQETNAQTLNLSPPLSNTPTGEYRPSKIPRTDSTRP